MALRDLLRARAGRTLVAGAALLGALIALTAPQDSGAQTAKEKDAKDAKDAKAKAPAPDAKDAKKAKEAAASGKKKKKPRPIDRVQARSLDPNAIRPRVIDGTPAATSEFPFQVALISSDAPEGREFEGQFCGASLINQNWVLTAAHCVPGVGPDDVDIYVGATVLPRKAQDRSPAAKRLKAALVISHEKYDDAAGNYDNDIALIKLKEPAPASLLVMDPARPGRQNPYRAGQKVMVVGWGLTKVDDPTSGSPKLMKGEVILQSSELCQANFTKYAREHPEFDPVTITGNMFCAGVPDASRDSAKGDSGGFIGISEPQHRYLQLGVVSYGIDATPGLFGVYTRIQNYDRWIKDKMAAN